MMESIFELLVEFGLIYKDDKHRKIITKKEKEDGRKRPFQKYFLQPSAIVFIVVLGIGITSSILFFTYQRTSIYPEKTKKELSEMVLWIEKCNEKFGEYPKDLEEAIGKSPMRQGWNTDAWGHSYKYVITNFGKGFLLLSAGPDGKFETEDDIGME